MPVDLDWKAAYREIKLFNWLTLLVLALVGFVLMSRAQTTGIILGGLIIIANFGALQHTIRRAFAPDGTMTSGKLSVIVKYYLRLLGLGVVLFILIGKGWVDPIGLALGLSTILISILGFGIRRAFRTYTREAT